MSETWTSRDWRKHEQNKIWLMRSVQHYQDIGYSDDDVLALVRDLLDFNRKWAERAARQKDPTDAETAALQMSDIKQGGQNGAIRQAAIARQEDPTDAND
jgi:hypothetical protein